MLSAERHERVLCCDRFGDSSKPSSTAGSSRSSAGSAGSGARPRRRAPAMAATRRNMQLQVTLLQWF